MYVAFVLDEVISRAVGKLKLLFGNFKVVPKARLWNYHTSYTKATSRTSRRQVSREQAVHGTVIVVTELNRLDNVQMNCTTRRNIGRFLIYVFYYRYCICFFIPIRTRLLWLVFISIDTTRRIAPLSRHHQLSSWTVDWIAPLRWYDDDDGGTSLSSYGCRTINTIHFF